MRLPGDQLVGDPVIQATEAVWIDASPSAVWPWLLQMGQDRGSLYSEALANLIGLRFHNADRVAPEWQQLAVGDVCDRSRGKAGWGCQWADFAR